ncbi:MAG: molybdopterin molybdotransferase [Alphaproteobacteria bacterium]|nr:molybdopterin molybdotransferase [Alphaproteobacteria bacterium]
MVDLRDAAQRIERLTPLADALAGIDQLVAPVAARSVEAQAACGRILAADIAAAAAHPAVALALRDGFAVLAEATLDASPYAPAALAGPPAPLEVGDPMPAGTDAVAPPDAIELRGGAACALAPLAAGDGILPPGADMAAGEVLRRAGARLRASDIAACAILGHSRVDVREPRLRIVPARPERDPVIAAIVSLLARAVEAAGGAVITAADANGLEGALTAEGADAVMVVGGSGSGRRDRSVQTLARHGRVAFHGVGLMPGETAAFGTIAERAVLVLPGRLDAALAVWLTLGTRMLARLCGRASDDEATTVVLTRKIASILGFAELVPVMRQALGVVPLASGYLSLQSLARADGFVLVPADREGYGAGAEVEMRPLP